MIKLDKILLLALVFASTIQAKSTFSSYSDICETTSTQSCANIKAEVKNLQIALNSDRRLNLHLSTDGRWGKNTQNAVKKFQRKYNISPVQGYVGTKTKRKLSRVYRNVRLKSYRKSSTRGNASSRESVATGSYAKFRRNTNLRKSYKVYKDNALLRRSTGRNTKLKIDISEQRARLYVNGKVALDSPCTTGAKRKFEPNTKIYRDKHTPKGTFKITEKIADKRSTIFGDYYRGSKRVYHGDRRKFRGSKRGLRYKGASLRNWMRLTSSGIGLHGSKYVKRYPGTNGCIRLPFGVARTIFSKVKRGTKVSVVN